MHFLSPTITFFTPNLDVATLFRDYRSEISQIKRGIFIYFVIFALI